ncbi:toxin-antitoxin system YwqK family antitoxin [Allomuricauda sp. R78024]|uniref:toxin-antitoxin system YwqK family antitoxin n=1 Tax=Allomuricauda sp. R78024 TaxID=3093867 RepID=UPI0037C6FA2A
MFSLKVIFPLFFTVFCFLIWAENRQRKIISDETYNYVFYVSTDSIKNYENSKKYYWYKSGEIHSSAGGNHGDLLDGQYTKSYRDSSIVEQGGFKKGLKNAVWKEWYSNGSLKRTIEWKEGFRSGWTIEYDNKGEIIEGGRFKENKKNGIWINGETKDTLQFKQGIQIKKENQKKFKDKVGIFLKSIFSRKEKDSLENKNSKKDRVKKRKRIKRK